MHSSIFLKERLCIEFLLLGAKILGLLFGNQHLVRQVMLRINRSHQGVRYQRNTQQHRHQNHSGIIDAAGWVGGSQGRNLHEAR